ncbi:hypothetical protein BH23PLA1_BH23PLA1_25940 [soil metagenome]
MATAEQTTPLSRLQAQGQSIWVDFMSREFLTGGELRRLIREDGLQGATSNPTIFEKAIGHSADYDEDMRRFVSEGADAGSIYRELTVHDIRTACDEFRTVYDRTGGHDGYVSLEVSPLLAHDTQGTIEEAKALWNLLDRPNAMIKIPGTPEGVPAVEECLASGLNINVTLLFSVEAYETVAHAYIRGLKRRADAGQPIDRIASVASFFVSRIDAETDKRLEAKSAPKELMGKVAIANAKNAYASFERIFGTPEFAALRDKGAKVQRLLWASVGTKNPDYPDTLYIDELIGPETVSTMPPATYDAFKDHGKVAEQLTLTQGMDEAQAFMGRLAEAGVDFQDVTALLLKQGVDSFAKSFDDLMGAIRSKREKLADEMGR